MFDTLKKHLEKVAKESKEAFYEGLDETPSNQEILDAYKILGLSKAASFEEIKTQFKALSKLYHPDSNSHSDSEQFIRIKEAYDVLKLHHQ